MVSKQTKPPGAIRAYLSTTVTHRTPNVLVLCEVGRAAFFGDGRPQRSAPTYSPAKRPRLAMLVVSRCAPRWWAWLEVLGNNRNSPHLNPLPSSGERRIPSPLSRKGEGQGEGCRSRSHPDSLNNTYSTSKTTTDLAGNVAVNPSPVSLNALNAPGLTASVFSKVLCACIVSAVRTRPDIAFGWAPLSVQFTSAVAFGLRLQSETWILPALSRDAETLNAGILSRPAD